MQALRTISGAALIAMLGGASLGVWDAEAKALYTADEPAEFPPASFKGTQYVDSRGCVYVRAGYGDGVQWVPRVSRDRRVLCGFKPTFESVTHKLPVIPDPVDAPAQTQVAAATPIKPAAPKMSVKPTTSVPTTPMPTATTAVLSKATPPKATPPKTIPKAAVPAPLPVAQTVQAPSLPSLDRLVGKAVGDRGCVATMSGGELRCDTGEVEYILKRLPAGVTVRTADGNRRTLTEPTLVRIPVKKAPVMVAPAPTYAAVAPAPMMMASAAPDMMTTHCAGLSGNAAQYMNTGGRYAVRCGPQAQHPSAYIQNRTATRLSTQNSNTVQVARAAGIDPYALPQPVPMALPAGYTQAWTDGRLNPYRGPITARGDLQMAQIWTQTTPAYDLYAPRKKTFWEWLFGSPFKSKTTAQVARAPAAQTYVAPTRMSTKSMAPNRTPTATAQPQAAQPGLRYVQVGTFGVPENAERSIARLSSMGFPVSSQVLTRNGKPLKIVLAGPFARPEQTMSALASVRGAGYGDAFARK
ncbi:MAG: SPOR domain-containing protein [Alphaproteobacteria bacterium]|nr:SPOR domain-containing protein [Alphaproteobacteria bacterium]MBU1279763.1 SPOR domain-containing protein [Alphaproteobacteria bacterium]MBU1574765.1 SPOR domain-containing protein [Alphaproteobacteria bacterium]MBU1829339.1 SPOR domain-containing protein [Alphaproteobacteria bacterium]MBU2079279.1 SPOR domain-containing protein [Alphaproteobacteria bacterium]